MGFQKEASYIYSVLNLIVGCYISVKSVLIYSKKIDGKGEHMSVL